MKKMIALLLTVITLFSVMVPVSATAVDTPAAPVIRSVQVKTVTSGENSTYHVRFLSTVHSLSGSALGYEISALFTDENGTRRVVYAAPADVNMEGNTIYSCINVAGKAEPVSAVELANGDAGAKGIFAVAITDVPYALDVIFTVKSYVLYNGEKIESDVAIAKYQNGQCVDVSTTDLAIVYQENFNDVELKATLSSDVYNNNDKKLADQTNSDVIAFNNAIQALGWKITSAQTWGGYDSVNQASIAKMSQTVSVANGAATLNGGSSTFQLVAPNTLTDYASYSMDMDITIPSLGMLNIMFNNSADAGNYNGTGEFLTFRNFNGKSKTGANVSSTTQSAMLLYTWNEGSLGVVNSWQKDKFAYGTQFHLTFLIDNTAKTVTVLLDGTVLFTANLSYTTGGGLELMIQNADVTIDNLVIMGISK